MIFNKSSLGMSKSGEGRHRESGGSLVESITGLLRQIGRDHANAVMILIYRRRDVTAPRPTLRPKLVNPVTAD